MRTLPCTKKQCRELQRRVNGTFYLYPDWRGGKKTDDVFIGYGDEIEMYEPGEYEEVAE